MIFSAAPHPVVYFAVLAGICAYLHLTFRPPHAFVWALAWTLLLARQLALALEVGVAGTWPPALLVLLAAGLLAAGGGRYAGRDRTALLAGAGALALAGGAAAAILLALHPAPHVPGSLAAVALAAAAGGAGAIVARPGRRVAPSGAPLTGLALAAWGLAQPVAWSLAVRGQGAQWLPEIDAALGALVAVGTAILGFEEGRARIASDPDVARGLLDEDPNLVLVLEGDRVAFVNRALVERLGVPRDVTLPDLVERVAPEDRAIAAAGLGERTAGRRVPDYEIDLVGADGHRFPIIVHADAIEWEGRPAFKYEILDITPRRLVEAEVRAVNEELKRINAELEKQSRLKSEFLSNTSHELKTPLTSIIANTEILEYEMAGPVTEEQRQVLANIGRNSQHLLEMISRLLDYARHEEGYDALQLEQVDVRTLLEGVAQTVQPLVEGRALNVALDVAPDLEPCWLDSDKVYRIYLNLVENAIKFSSEGTIRVGARRVDGEMEGSVADQGIGIPPEQLGDVFDAFHQLHDSATRPYQGVGLGLAICRQLAELHGGRIWVESTTGAGSVFRFRVPYRTEPPEAAEA